MPRDASLSTTQYIELRGNRFAYTQRGSGPVVITHGLTSSRANNRIMGLSDFSEVLDAGRQLSSYDAREHGESSGTRSAEDYSWADLAKDMIALALLSTLTQASLILPWAGDSEHPVVTAQEPMSAAPNAQLHVTDAHEDLLIWGQRSVAFLGGDDL